MKLHISRVAIAILSLVLVTAAAQETSSSAGTPIQTVPPLIQFSNVATDEGGNTMSGVVSITFSLYSSPQGGEALWMETQNNVQLDSTGHYSVQLGITKPNGVPMTLFTTGEARWLGIQIAEQPPQPRVLLLSVPYALKAGDAATIGGLPPSAFVLAASPNGSAAAYATESATGQSVSSATSTDVTTSGGTVDYLPLWDATSDITSSVVFQSGTGSTAKIGINNATPATTLDVKGTGTIRGTLSVLGSLALPATGPATATAGKNSEPLSLSASAFNSSTSAAVNQTFRWQAEPAGNDTSTLTGTLNLLFGEGTSAPEETGLHIASDGQITFATGQTFPGTGTGNGTITGVTAATGLTGGGTSGTVSLALASNACASGSALTALPFTCAAFATSGANSFTGNQSVTGNVTASGEVQGGVVNATSSFDLGGTMFASGSASSQNALLGFAGNTTMTGGDNTASGYQALYSNTAGHSNSATGALSLTANTTGVYNAGFGNRSLQENTTGNYNVGVGAYGGQTTDGNPLTGTNDTGVGAGSAFGSDAITNATAIGSNAVVSESDALVLGCTPGVNGCGGTVYVGIGTTEPVNQLDVYAKAPIIYAVNAVGFSGAPDSGFTGGAAIFATGGNGDPDSEASFGGQGVYGTGGTGPYGDGPGGVFTGGDSGPSGSFGDGIEVFPGSGEAGSFGGDVDISGTLTKGGGSFKIDHPLDPANKYLYHSFVESPDMMNVYNGNIVLDDNGEAVIQMPEWFGVLNRDFRYQLTCIGGFAPVYVADEISNNRFRIAGGKPGLKVSWQVTGIRQDAWANAHRIPVEEEKDARMRGFYIHPELYGAPPEKQIEWARHPQMMKRMKEQREAQQLAAAREQATATRAETLPSDLKETRPPVPPATAAPRVGTPSAPLPPHTPPQMRPGANPSTPAIPIAPRNPAADSPTEAHPLNQ